MLYKRNRSSLNRLPSLSQGVHLTVREKKSSTIVHFGTDRPALLLRARNLSQLGYDVLNSSNGFEAIQLACLEVVDAVVLDQDRDCAEVELIVTEIKRFRPRLPTILLAEEQSSQRRTQELADAWVKRGNLEMLAATLKDVLCEPGEAASG
jgi:CheY-like chemotaxis protein